MDNGTTGGDSSCSSRPQCGFRRGRSFNLIGRAEKFGIHDTALKWFSNYLQPRSCCVNIAKEYSKDISLTFSVPQGSCAGPVLYLVYASTLQEVIPGNFQLHGYADDHIFKCAFNASDRKAEIETVTSIESCAQDIKAWMDNNRLRMNSSKTELILFGNSVQVAKCQTKELNINQEKVQLTDTIKYLGVWLDKQLNLKHHIVTAMYNIHRIKQIY